MFSTKRLLIVGAITAGLLVSLFIVLNRQGQITIVSQTKPKQLNKKERSQLVYKGQNNPHSEKLKDIAAISKGDVRIERELGLPSLTPAGLLQRM